MRNIYVNLTIASSSVVSSITSSWEGSEWRRCWCYINMASTLELDWISPSPYVQALSNWVYSCYRGPSEAACSPPRHRDLWMSWLVGSHPTAVLLSDLESELCGLTWEGWEGRHIVGYNHSRFWDPFWKDSLQSLFFYVWQGAGSNVECIMTMKYYDDDFHWALIGISRVQQPPELGHTEFSW